MRKRGANIVVTGGAGFIGSHLVDKLVALGNNVVVIDNLSSGVRKNINKKASFIKLDIRNFDKLKRNLKNKDLIYHLAASATTKESWMGWKDPLYDYEVNAVGTLNVLRAVAGFKRCPKIICASSAAVYGRPQKLPIDEKHPTKPVSPYGVSKLAGEKYCYAYCREYGMDTICFRIFNTYGPRQPRYVMYDFIKKLKKNSSRLEVLGDGTQIRDYCYVSDTVNAFIHAAALKGSGGEVFNIAGGNEMTIKELANKFVDHLGAKDKTRIFYTGSSWKGDINMLRADIKKAKRKLGFRPITKLDDGIRKLIDWHAAYEA
ncbi:GDP-mannose 4,6-dehydratase [Candidatus Omnitrophota bacterium]